MHKNDDKKHAGRGLIVSILIGTASGYFLVLVLFAVLASLIASGKAPENTMRIIVVAAAFIGAFAGAFVAVRQHRGKIMTLGLSVGGLMFAMTLFGALLSENGLGGSLMPSFLVAFVTGGIFGGLANLKRKKHKHAA